MAHGNPVLTEGDVTVVPANQAPWADLQAVFGPRGEAARCQCQYFRTERAEWRVIDRAERAARLHAQTRCGDPDAPATSGLVGYLDAEPVAWCAVEPRPAYLRLRGGRIPWAGRDEDRDDPGVWAVTCFFTRLGYRRRGMSAVLTRAAVQFARQRGARAVEGYPMIPRPGQEVTWGELFIGSRSSFADAGFTEVSRPTPRRAVMRLDFPGA
jgi:GNAT superfamily N-acetyltransferase